MSTQFYFNKKLEIHQTIMKASHSLFVIMRLRWQRKRFRSSFQEILSLVVRSIWVLNKIMLSSPILCDHFVQKSVLFSSAHHVVSQLLLAFPSLLPQLLFSAGSHVNPHTPVNS